jgi:uncharacterized HAD superfamily protein
VALDQLDDDLESDDSRLTPKTTNDFLLAEYNSIAQAHFNTTTSIATFFKNYLAIVGLPLPLLVLVLTQLGKSDIDLNYLDSFSGIVPIVTVLVGFLGLSVLAYVANLRVDALLYARAVNGIRKHFYNMASFPLAHELSIRVLPRSIYQPRYLEKSYFFPVVLAFAILDAGYPALGGWWYLNHRNWPGVWSYCLWIGVALFAASHLALYVGLAYYRETQYLRTYKIGVDIDGVLNKHRDHFCRLLGDVRGVSVSPQQITRIPVHEISNLGVSEADEDAVFNHPDYWIKMPVDEDASKTLKRIRNALGYKVFIFTYRPWPEPKSFPSGREEEYRSLWNDHWPHRKLNSRAVDQLTRDWLVDHGFEFDELIVEKGNVHTVDPRFKVHNRFVISQRREIRVFVEDDLFKAKKLANICELVFLPDHPYNQASGLPNNIVRVHSWDEIYRYMREVL